MPDGLMRAKHYRGVGRLLAVATLATSLTALPIGSQDSAKAAVSDSIDHALNFDRTFTALANNGPIPTGDGDEFSVEAWVKVDSAWGYTNDPTTDYQAIVVQGEGATTNANRFGLFLYAESATKFNVHIGRDSNSILNIQIPDPRGKWMHLAASVASNDDVKVYLDGRYMGQANLPNAGTDSGFAIGSNDDASSNKFLGQIDQVKVWSGVLEEGDFAASMNAWGDSHSSLNLHALYDFNVLDSSTVDNIVSASNDLVLTNAATSDYLPVAITDSSTIPDKTLVTFPRSYLTSQGGWAPPVGLTSIDYLIVGGGGGGNGRHGGGGGAGGFLEGTTSGLTGNAQPIVVGTGGFGSSQTSDRNNFAIKATRGGDSSAFGITSYGGGPGLGWGTDPDSHVGPFGSGGATTGASPGALGTDGQGNNGGSGTGSCPNDICSGIFTGGGGGGAGGAGEDAQEGVAGAGGAGKQSFITGKSVGDPYYAAGGGGAVDGEVSSYTAGIGGSGIGGNGGDGAAGTDGANLTGSGGGGGGHNDAAGIEAYAGGNGGSGVVIVRYAYNLPGEVANFSATTRLADADSDPDSVTLSWDALTASPDVTSYQIEYSTDGITWATGPSVAAPTTTATIADLTDGARYYFRIKAVNAVGPGSVSPVVTSVPVSTQDYALQIDGQQVQVAASAQAIPSSGPFTFEAWIRPESQPSWRSIVYQGTENTNRFNIYLNVQTIHVARDTSGTTINAPVGDITGQWSHLAVTVSSSNLVTLYFNGVSVASATMGATSNPAAEFSLGFLDIYSSPRDFFDGHIDQVKIWDEALTPTEVASSMHTWGKGSIGKTLRAHWDFNDSTQAGILLDQVGSLDLTLNNASTSDFKPLVTADIGSKPGYTVYAFSRSYLTATGGWSVPNFNSTPSALLVAGGGGGGDSDSGSNRTGGTGGAGGFYQSQSLDLTGVVPIKVGLGGRGASSQSGAGLNGGDSQLGDLIVGGGGGGASWAYTAALVPPANGGSNYVSGGNGGGGRSNNVQSTRVGETGGLGGAHATSGIFYAGATNLGHAGVNGGNDCTCDNGSGGVGGSIASQLRTSDITGISVEYAKPGPYRPWTDPQNTSSPKTPGSGGPANYLYGTAETLLGGNGESGLVVVSFLSSSTVTYKSGSNGTGGDQTALKLVGQPLALADEATANSWFDRVGYKVIGWSTADDYTAEFGLAGIYSVDADLTLYPVWGVDRITTSGDSFVDNGGQGTAKGGLASINLKNSPTLGTVTRYGYLEFDYDPNVTWNNSILELTVVANNGGGACSPDPNAVACLWNKEYTSFQVEIYGVSDASWDEGTLTWNIANASNLAWGLNADSFPYLPNSGTLLGSIDIPTNSGSIGQRFTLSSSALDQFLDGDTDGNVTFFMRRLDLDGNGNLEFASLQNADPTKRPALRLSAANESFSISYNINGGTGQLPSSGSYTNGGAAYVIEDPVSVTPPSGQVFLRWDTDPNGNGTAYEPGDSYSTPRTLTLYAIYGVVQQTVTPTLAYANTTFSPSGTVSPTVNAASHDGGRTFTRSTAETCDVNASSGVVTIKQAGTCTVSVAFAETANYAAATATDSFEITKANQAALVWDQSKIAYSYLGSLDLSTVISGGSGTGTVTFTDNNAANGCRVTGNVLSGGNAGTTCTITVTKGADTNYNSADLTQSITINKINQSVVSIVNPGAQVFGGSVQLSSTGGSGTGAISFNSTSSSVCTESTEGNFEFVGVGNCVVTVEKAADTNYNAATGSLTIAVAKADHTLSFTSAVPANPVTNGTYTVSGVSSTGDAALAPNFRIASGSASICSISGTTVTFILDGPCDIEAYREGTSNYNAAPEVTQRVVVGQANQTITFAALPDRTFGDPAFTVSATSSANNAVTFTRGSNTSNNSCSITSGGLVVVAAVGTCEIVANSASGNGYAAASPVSRTFDIAADTAGAPFITAVSFGDGSLTATYFAPGYLGGGTISGYRLQAFDSSNNLIATQSSCATSGTLSCTITGLNNGTSYSLKIAAITEAGLGAVSPASSSKIPAANPAAVSNLTAIQGDTILTVSWEAPVSLGGGTFDSFRVFVREQGGAYPETPISLFTGDLTPITSGGVTTYVLTGLTNGQAYDVRVVTVTSANSSPLTSNTAEVTQTPYTVPDAPPTVTVLEVDDDIVITWDVPLFDGGSAISDYEILLDSVPATCAATSATSCTIPKNSLTPGTTVAIEVKAENDAGMSSPASTSFQVASLPGSGSLTPGAPVVDEGPAAGIEAVSGQSWVWTKRISKNEVKVYIKFPEMAANYQINLQKNDGDWVRKVSKTINSTSDTDLRVVGDAYYLVRTIELPGEGRYRIEVTQDGQRTVLNGEDRPVVYTYR